MNVIVKDSKIHKKGVYANRDFKKGEIVLKWNTSNKLTEEQVKALPEEEKDYTSYNDGDYIHMQPPERFVNHSCEPNTNSKDCKDVAIRDIKKGEEITSDYSHDFPPDFEMECMCNSEKCKKVIKRNLF